MRFFLVLLSWMRFIPRPILKIPAYLLGDLLFFLSGDRRRATQYNIDTAFPEKSKVERYHLVRQHFRLFVLALFDHTYIWFGSAEQLKNLVKVTGLENLPKDQPTLWFAPHFLGLDAGGMRLVVENKMVAMYVKQKNPAFDDMLKKSRERFMPAKPVSRQDGARALLKAFKEGYQLHYSPDQDFGSRDAVFVPFFGKSAATVTALPRIAQVTKTVVVPVITTMEKDGYTVRFMPAWENYPTGNLEADTLKMNQWLEAVIREYPAQYFWLHKRYKTRPDGEKNPYKK
ncbi:lysophospholipid acyltransferase family protein [Leeia sp. TBRC 13508]|uniref:Lysophospholipid acyltransferase family protein n=1 Tax=Leeia speluncae TaxID=2884804 RepID=A0ABS8D398_9NEIS|nr:lysophospholipid acyltransferase family protein [Leeia speluncae]MCB6182670.1 lysophospholipid acyltransferase family protein [Leeia speluncae]